MKHFGLSYEISTVQHTSQYFADEVLLEDKAG